MKLKYFLLSGVLATFAVGPLQAQMPDPTATPPPAAQEGKGHGGHHHEWIWKKLNLTDTQKLQIKAIKQSFRPQFRPALAGFLTARKQLEDDVRANKPESILTSDAAALGAAEGKVAVLRAQELSQIKAILTSEQLTTLNEFQQRRDTRLQERIDKLSQPTI
ncbi:MAG: Spy/CpxP family protein refolding chaperone [Verrucomicrobia bacterium]|nr:Spy/CpxP family protein refolding chaperone [Verrucomicrobiota bacterium]